MNDRSIGLAALIFAGLIVLLAAIQVVVIIRRYRQRVRVLRATRMIEAAIEREIGRGDSEAA